MIYCGRGHAVPNQRSYSRTTTSLTRRFSYPVVLWTPYWLSCHEENFPLPSNSLAVTDATFGCIGVFVFNAHGTPPGSTHKEVSHKLEKELFGNL